MKWVNIMTTAVNTDNMDAFKWENGTLYVFFNSQEKPDEWEDPDAQLYYKLCRAVYVVPVVMRD